MCQPNHIYLAPIPLRPKAASINGNDGVAITGREHAYSVELWLQNPSAFWLHPEGPLSDTTPEEWQAKQAAKVLQRVNPDLEFRHRIKNLDMRPAAHIFMEKAGRF